MQALKNTFRTVSPKRSRRYDHKFTNPKFKPKFRGPRRKFSRPKR